MAVRLQLLGGIRAHEGDRDLTWVPGQPVRSALLLYLAVEVEATRDQLALVFWPDEEAERARHSLSQTLYLLRRALGEGFIQQQGDIVRLGTRPETDVADFEAAVTAGELDRAASLYRGAFLEDVRLVESREFEEWVDRQRARLERLHRHLRREQVDQHVTRGDLPGAIEVARAWVAIEPFEDEAQHRLIELLSLAGRRQEALAQYDSYERLLRGEELEPLDETKALVAELRAGRATAGDRPALEALALPSRPPAGQPSPAPPGSAGPGSPGRPARRRRMVAAGLAVGAVLLLAGAGTSWFLHLRGPARPPASTGPRTDSIAVLACANLTGDPAREYFSDGVAEEVLQALSGVEGLVVRARGSSFAFKGTREDMPAIAARLRVGHLVECSLRGAGDSVRIDVRLVDGRSGAIGWKKRYEGKSDPLAMQDNIARATVDALKLRLLPDSTTRLVSGGTSNPDARDAYLQGRAVVTHYTRAALDSAIAFFQLAVHLDPSFARAHAALASAAVEYHRDWARQAAVTALQLDPTLAEPTYVLGRLATSWREKRLLFDETMRKEPGWRDGYYLSGNTYVWMGDRKRAIWTADRLLALDPLSPTSHYMAATVLNHSGLYARADSVAARGAQLDSAGFRDVAAPRWPPFWNRGHALLMLGRYEEAVPLLEQSAILNGGSKEGIAQVIGAIAAVRRARQGWQAERDAAVRSLRAGEGRFGLALGPGFVAHCYLLLNERNAMYALLESIPPQGLHFLRSAFFDAVSQEPRFKELVRKSDRFHGVE